jgi:hybrid cluster-associated redox disulfide protein
MMVADVLAAGRETVRVFVDHRMGCVGCPFASFETLAEAAAAHAIDPASLVDALVNAGHRTSTEGSSS